jgi:hypothetical protein
METSARLRVDATGLRALAERMRDPSTKACLSRLADDWDASGAPTRWRSGAQAPQLRQADVLKKRNGRDGDPSRPCLSEALSG